MRLHYRPGGFFKNPQPLGLFLCRPRTFSNLRSSLPSDGDFTHRKPAAIPPQYHLVTCRTRRGFNFYRGERIWNCWWRQYDWQLRKFPYTCILLSVRRVRTTNTIIRLRMHRLISTCPFGGNLHLAGTCACFDAHEKADFLYGFKIS